MDSKIKRFMILEHRDSHDVYKNALIRGGYRLTDDPDKADFYFYDLERPRECYKLLRERFFGKIPMFIYPHSAMSWYMWDGIHIAEPVQANFVYTEKIKEGMQTYGYPYRIEPCGWGRTELLPWKPVTTRKTLLYAPVHTLGGGKKVRLTNPADLELNKETFDHVIKISKYFEQVIVRYSSDIKKCGLREVGGNIRFELSNLTTQGTIDAINRTDVVLGCGSLAYMAVAIGKPTIFFNQGGTVPQEWTWPVSSYEKYKWLDYPIQFKDMSDSDITSFSKSNSKEVEDWKSMNIGKPFNRSKFLSVVREYV